MPFRPAFRYGLSVGAMPIRQAVFLGIPLALALFPSFCFAQAPVDTTSSGYKIGYQIGSWLPFVVLAAFFLWMLTMLMRQNRETQS